MRILLARLRVGRLRLAAALALIVALVVAIPVIANLSGSDFDAGDGNLVLNDEAQGLGQRAEPQGWYSTSRPANRTTRSARAPRRTPRCRRSSTGRSRNNKSDLTRFYVANETRLRRSEFLYLAWERVQEPNGTTNMDFEFNQSTDGELATA